MSMQRVNIQPFIAGPLRLYRVTNTGVSFIHSGGFLKPLLQRSQCWLVDDKSIFVLRLGPDTFYRVELPYDLGDDRERVEELKVVLDQILRLDKTPSPFSLGFAEIPDDPPTPVRSGSIHSIEPAKKWRLNKIWEPEDAERRAEFQAKIQRRSSLRQEFSPGSFRQRRGQVISQAGLQENGEAFESAPEKSISSPIRPNSAPRIKTEITEASPISGSPAKRIEVLKQRFDSHESILPKKSAFEELSPSSTLRSVTAPLLVNPTPSSSSENLDIPQHNTDSVSLSSSSCSFHTAASDEPESQSIGSGLGIIDGSVASTTPSLTYDDSSVDTSTQTFRHSSEEHHSNVLDDSIESGDDDDDDEPDTFEDSTDLHHPPPLSLLSPVVSGSPTFSIKRPVGTALIRKTYSLLVGPPSQVFVLMLSIATRILHGAPSYASPSRRLPGSWDDATDDEYGVYDYDSEDDYGYPLNWTSSGQAQSQYEYCPLAVKSEGVERCRRFTTEVREVD